MQHSEKGKKKGAKSQFVLHDRKKRKVITLEPTGGGKKKSGVKKNFAWEEGEGEDSVTTW